MKAKLQLKHKLIGLVFAICAAPLLGPFGSIMLLRKASASRKP